MNLDIVWFLEALSGEQPYRTKGCAMFALLLREVIWDQR
jgi:hypothetical protein